MREAESRHTHTLTHIYLSYACVWGVCHGRSNGGPCNLTQMKPNPIPGDRCDQTVQSCRKSISTWWDSLPPSHLSLPTPVNKATQGQQIPAVPLKRGCVFVCVCEHDILLCLYKHACVCEYLYIFKHDILL